MLAMFAWTAGKPWRTSPFHVGKRRNQQTQVPRHRDRTGGNLFTRARPVCIQPLGPTGVAHPAGRHRFQTRQASLQQGTPLPRSSRAPRLGCRIKSGQRLVDIACWCGPAIPVLRTCIGMGHRGCHATRPQWSCLQEAGHRSTLVMAGSVRAGRDYSAGCNFTPTRHALPRPGVQ